MAGIYIHIPYCKSKCAYCDFYSVVNPKSKQEFVQAICKEIEIQKDYLENENVQTIYFGGGTPSMLENTQIEKILNHIHRNFKVEKNSEITLEANPDHLTEAYLKSLRTLGVNRLSIGIQSFNDVDLHVMKRKHTGNEAIRSVENAQDAGFGNISVDLIYGLPDLTIEAWEKNINRALELNIQHISAYHLTIEPRTVFQKLYENKKLNLPTEDESLEQFKMLQSKTAEKGFLHYEISNFALDGFISLHNTNYWLGVKYLGLGPSAHSYNLTSRQWNIQNLPAYLVAISKGEMVFEIENLTENEKYNDFIITSLRTMWGLNTEKLKRDFDEKYLNYFLRKIEKYIGNHLLKKSNNNYILTENGIFISDTIFQDLLFD